MVLMTKPLQVFLATLVSLEVRGDSFTKLGKTATGKDLDEFKGLFGDTVKLVRCNL